MACRVAFLGVRSYDIISSDKINEWCEFSIRYYKGYLDINNIVLAQRVDAVCIFVNDTADVAVIGALVANGVELSTLRCAGFNNVNLNAARGKLPVVRMPACSPYAVTEYTLALMLSLGHKTYRTYWRARDGNFSLSDLVGFDIHGEVAGIIGTGRIAKVLIRTLKGLGMRILANNLYPDEKFAKEKGIIYVSLDELYKESDTISLHYPSTSRTHYLINDDSIAKVKNGIVIISTEHGLLIHASALIEGLKIKEVSAAGLDICKEEKGCFYEGESGEVIDGDVLTRLLSSNSVIVTSRQAFFMKEALHNVAGTILRNIRDFEENCPLVNEVTK